MGKTLCINLLSGYQENEDALFAMKLSKAALEKGYGVTMFLYGSGCNLANKEEPVKGEGHITERLRAHMDIGRVAPLIEEVAALGANISTCHTTEYGRGTEGLPYLEGVKWGDVGESFYKMLMKADVLVTLGH
jgi:tRNA 2-thiouridine synthesizing protein D